MVARAGEVGAWCRRDYRGGYPVISCPICDYEPEPDVDDPRNSVIGHMSSSKGEHEGIGFERAGAMLDANDAVESEDLQEDDADPVETDDREQNVDDEPDQDDDAGLGLSGEPDVSTSDQDELEDVEDETTPADATIMPEGDPGDDVERADDESDSSLGAVAAIAAVGVAALLALRHLGQAQDDETDETQNIEFV